MYHSWTFAHPHSGHPHRAQRVALRTTARLFLQFESWQLMWSLTTFNISRTGMLVGFEVKDEASAQSATDLETLIQAEPEARLQIEHDRPHLFAPVVFGRLVRSARHPWGLELAFTFTDSDLDLLTLLEELESGVATGKPISN